MYSVELSIIVRVLPVVQCSTTSTVHTTIGGSFTIMLNGTGVLVLCIQYSTGTAGSTLEIYMYMYYG